MKAIGLFLAAVAVTVAFTNCRASASEHSAQPPVPSAQLPAPSAQRPVPSAQLRVLPMVAVRGGGWEAGLRFSWNWGPGGAKSQEARAKGGEPTRDAAGRTAYVERAVPLWRASPGELVAAAGSGIADINAAVVARDEAPKIPVEWPMWRRGVAHVGRHFEYRKTEWTVGGVVAAVAAAVGVAMEDERDADAAQTTPEPPKDAALVVVGTGNIVTVTDDTGSAGGQVFVSGQGNTVTVVRRPPEEE